MLHSQLLQYRFVSGMLALLLFTCPHTAFSSAAPVDPVVQAAPIARVNGVPIFSESIEAGMENRIAQYRKMGSRLPEDQLRLQLQRKELEGLIDRELLVQAGAALKPNDIEQRLAKRVTPHAAGDTAPAANRENLQKEILQEILLEKHGVLDLKVSEQEMLLFYEKNIKSFKESRSVQAKHILIRLPKGATDTQVMEANQKAKRVLADLKQGKDFGAAARELSDCSSKENGGDLGTIKENFMPKEFDAVAFKLKPGEMSDIVKTRYGMHIIKVEKVIPEKVAGFQEVKEYIAGYLKKDLQRKKVGELVQQLRKTAKIEILL